mgnify:CR=1 FL=1
MRLHTSDHSLFYLQILTLSPTYHSFPAVRQTCDTSSWQILLLSGFYCLIVCRCIHITNHAQAIGKSGPSISASFNCRVWSSQWASCTKMSFSVMPFSPNFTTFSRSLPASDQILYSDQTAWVYRVPGKSHYVRGLPSWPPHCAFRH